VIARRPRGHRCQHPRSLAERKKLDPNFVQAVIEPIKEAAAERKRKGQKSGGRGKRRNLVGTSTQGFKRQTRNIVAKGQKSGGKTAGRGRAKSDSFPGTIPESKSRRETRSIIAKAHETNIFNPSMKKRMRHMPQDGRSRSPWCRKTLGTTGPQNARGAIGKKQPRGARQRQVAAFLGAERGGKRIKKPADDTQCVQKQLRRRPAGESREKPPAARRNREGSAKVGGSTTA